MYSAKICGYQFTVGWVLSLVCYPFCIALCGSLFIKVSVPFPSELRLESPPAPAFMTGPAEYMGIVGILLSLKEISNLLDTKNCQKVGNSLIFWQIDWPYFTLRPCGTLLFSGLPMMIWQKNCFTKTANEMMMMNFFSCQMAKVKTAFCDFTEKLLVPNRHWTTKSSNHSGSQIHGRIFLKKKFYYISFYSSFCNLSPFHREWLALIQILMI